MQDLSEPVNSSSTTRAENRERRESAEHARIFTCLTRECAAPYPRVASPYVSRLSGGSRVLLDLAIDFAQLVWKTEGLPDV